MLQSATLRPTLAEHWLSGASRIRALALLLAGVALLTLSARIQIPFWPVPMTLQTYAVLVIAMAYGPGLGVATVTAYLLAGAAGLPVFAQGGGAAYLLGPTAGYLLGFVLATALLGWLARRGWDRSLPRALAAMLAGEAVIFACGVTWLAAHVGMEKAIAAGLLPFLAGEMLKLALAAATLPLAWRLNPPA
ncbi:MAG TPA: biotin transporter BioY [Candidatus Competibacteraceae bacterium]|nr:biotin transporter BioY [Candidatus Competibacteraceae bacterium]